MSAQLIQDFKRLSLRYSRWEAIANDHGDIIQAGYYRNFQEEIFEIINKYEKSPKSREDTTSAEAPLNSKKSASASSTAISTEEGKK